jgi:hypothetical protein
MRLVQSEQLPLPPITAHVLLELAGGLEQADARERPLLTDAVIQGVVGDLPEDCPGGEALFPTLAAHRAAYRTYLAERLNGPRGWLHEAIEARGRGPERLAVRRTHRDDVEE